MSFALSPDPEKPKLNGIHVLSSGADIKPRYSLERSRTVRYAEVASWLMSKETVNATASGAAAMAAERVCQQLFQSISRLISPVGSQAILSRALHLTGRTFPFLNDVSAGRPPAEAYLGGLRDSLSTIDEGATGEALRAVLGTVLGLLVDFIGEDLTFRLVRETWLDLPIREPGRRVTPNGHKATT